MATRLVQSALVDYTLPSHMINRSMVEMIESVVESQQCELIDALWAGMTSMPEAWLFVERFFNDFLSKVNMDSFMTTCASKRKVMDRSAKAVQCLQQTFQAHKQGLPAPIKYFCNKCERSFDYIFAEWLVPILCFDF